MSELPLLIPLSPILSPAYPLLHCLPLLSSLPDSIFFFFFWFCPSFENIATPFCHPLVASSLGCIDHCLSPRCCTCLVVVLIMHHPHDQGQTGLIWLPKLEVYPADLGLLSLWGHCRLSGRFLASLMCSAYSDLTCILCILHSKGTRERNVPLASLS